MVFDVTAVAFNPAIEAPVRAFVASLLLVDLLREKRGWRVDRSLERSGAVDMTNTLADEDDCAYEMKLVNAAFKSTH